MKFLDRGIRSIFIFPLALFVFGIPYGYAAPGAKKALMEGAASAFDINRMSDMSEYDPAEPVVPTGDTIRIAIVASFSGLSAVNSSLFWVAVQWAAHDLNKRGGIRVDGKKKLIQVLKADHMSRAEQCKKVCERMILQEKVHILWGTDGSNMMKIINETANKYRVIAMNAAAPSDELQDATNFGRYAFQPTVSTEQIGRGLAYYYGRIRNRETKFYILCQDYAFGHLMAEGFKKGLKEYHPGARIAGEDYHRLFLTDFAPYLTKIKASGAEVIFTGDWVPDAANLLKQARQMGVDLPFANVFMDDPNLLYEVGVEGSKGMVHVDQIDMPAPFKNPDYARFHKAWNDQWKNKWKTPPYNSRLFEHPVGSVFSFAMKTYWLLSVIERAGSTNPEKIIALWEGDSYRLVNGKVMRMRACDHKAIQDLSVTEYVPPEKQRASFTIPPYHWFRDCSWTGRAWPISASKILPWMDKELERCKGRNGWGQRAGEPTFSCPGH